MSLVSASGASVSSATTNSTGQFTLATPKGGGPYRVSVDSSNFRTRLPGPCWLGTGSITPTSGLGATAQALLSVPLIDLAMIIAYLWIWAGFAMIIIGAGLASLNPEVLEAARTEGASEWQVFRRITVPMLSPVLIVVFVTMVINVLKVFDIILNMAPGSSQAAGEHAGARDIQRRLHRRDSLRALERHRGGPVPAGGARDAVQPQAGCADDDRPCDRRCARQLPPRRVSAVSAPSADGCARPGLCSTSCSWRSRCCGSSQPISLLIISLRPEALFRHSGLVEGIHGALAADVPQLQHPVEEGSAAGGVLSSLLTSLEITVPAAILVTGVSSMAAYSLVFGQLARPRSRVLTSSSR